MPFLQQITHRQMATVKDNVYFDALADGFKSLTRLLRVAVDEHYKDDPPPEHVVWALPVRIHVL